MGTVRENTVTIGDATYRLNGDPERMPAGLLRLGRKLLQRRSGVPRNEAELMDAFGMCEDALRFFLGEEQYGDALPDLDAMPVRAYVELAADLMTRAMPAGTDHEPA